ncbi:MAG: hypothetical protein FD180_2791 [Planctomycetota bacterium]|nr:MAG: hypothetical protein FD180_2791 [Planctomycetota bacterium]
MYAAVSNKLSVVNGVDQFSSAVAMSGSNAARVEFTIFANSATSLSIDLQGSNDLQNWAIVGSAHTGYVVGYNSFAETAVSFQFVRLRQYVVGTGTVIIAAGINTAAL